MTRRVRAFTLIELLGVMLVMALLATVAVMSFATPIRAARARAAVEMIRSFDRSTRELALRGGTPLRMKFDADEGTLTRSRGGSAIYSATLPSGFRIAEMRGGATIDCSALGLTRSYALRITGEHFDQWLIVAGLSGQITATSDERTVINILASPPPRADTD